MTDAPIIQADFVKPQPVPSRKVLQLVFEVPEENADHAMAILGGFPQSGKNRWCAIARLNTEAADTGAAEAQETQPAPAVVEDAPEKMKGGPKSMAAGRLCGEDTFQKWLFRREIQSRWPGWAESMTAKGHATGCVRWLCGVKSRAELDHNEAAGQIWDRIEADYRAAERGDQETQLRSGPG